MGGEELIEFAGSLPKVGFVFGTGTEPTTGKEGRFLVEADYDTIEPQRQTFEERLRVIHPLTDSPGLFRDFADLPPDEDAIQEFASEHGRLGFKTDARFGELGLADAESIEAWRQEIDDMREAATLWEAIQGSDRERLTQWMEAPDGWDRHREEPWNEMWKSAGSPLKTEGLEGERAERIDESDASTLARFVIQSTCNQKLRDHSVPRVLHHVHYERGTPIDRLTLHIVPDNLLGAMWLQLAWHLSGDRPIRQCESCAKWYPLSWAGRKKHGRFCSNKCRMRAQRRKQDQARQLHHEDGKTIEEIAEQLSARPEAVHRWVFGRKRGED
jgi:hypothetical protein